MQASIQATRRRPSSEDKHNAEAEQQRTHERKKDTTLNARLLELK